MLPLGSLRLTLLIGPGLPVPAPPTLVEAMTGAEVTHQDDGRSGFQLTFGLSRAGVAEALDWAALAGPLLRPFNRVILMLTGDVLPAVLMDGIITHRAHVPDADQGGTTVTVTGEDVGVIMDLEEKRVPHPGLSDTLIVLKIIAGYLQYGLVPDVRPPLALDLPLPIERIPSQQGTDLAFLRRLAARNGFVFTIDPGPAPGANRAYWGPPDRLEAPQPALCVGLGRDTNVASLSFAYDALAPAVVDDAVTDSRTGVSIPVKTFTGLRVPPFASQPALPALIGPVRKTVSHESSGVDAVTAYARAQAATDRSTDAVQTATGELDVLRYGRVLQARGVVGVRGAGWTHDGFYAVRRVTHRIRPGAYTQSFVLSREGAGAILPVVVP